MSSRGDLLNGTAFTEQTPPSVIFDTTTVTSAAFNPHGVSEKLVKLMEGGIIAVTMSNRIRSEYEATLFLPRHALRLPFLTPAYLAQFLQRFDQYAERVPNPPRHMAYPRDPNDEPFINLAVEIRADFSVTLDKDLLDLPCDPEFARLPHQPRVLRPGAFLTEMENWV